jgi:phosphoribosylformylglycinamidine synthase
MTQKYPNGDKVLSPGTVIISTVGESEDVYATIHPVVQKEESTLYYIPFTSDRSYPLGGSAFAQTIKKVGAETADVKDPEYFKSCFNTLQDVMFRSGNTPVLAGHDVSAGGLATTLLEMCFANVDGGLDVDLTAFESARILFSEVPAVVVQVKAGAEDSFVKALGNVAAYKIGKFAKERCINIALPGNKSLSLDIDKMRDVWFETSYLFDVHQVGKELAKERYTNYKNQPLQYSFPAGFTGKYDTPAERKHTAAIIREKGSNGDREMAWALYMAGFNVKDVHMTDLITGRETLEDVNMIVFVGGFSNADTLGSAKGWAGAFQYNEKAKKALENFYSRKDTLSLGVCNGCQLMAELGLITYEERERSPKMQHNNSHKYESAFVGVQVENSPAVLLSSLTGSKLGIWVAHGEGKFSFPESIDKYNVALRYTYNSYPANPNGSPEGIAGVCSQDGRHLAMMPHPERCLRPWNWAHYPYEKRNEEVTPWIELFINGKKWLERQ